MTPPLSRGVVALVLVILWGWFAVRSISVGFGPSEPSVAFDDSTLIQLVVYEALAGAIACWILKRHGWILDPRSIGPSWELTAAGGLLLLLAYVLEQVSIGVAMAFQWNAQPLREIALASRPSWPAVLVASAVNGTYEELVLVRFIFAALEREGLSFVIGLSVALRFVAHVYQGPVGAFSILTFGLFFALVYARYRRTWPLIVAHIGLDFLALAR